MLGANNKTDATKAKIACFIISLLEKSRSAAFLRRLNSPLISLGGRKTPRRAIIGSGGGRSNFSSQKMSASQKLGANQAGTPGVSSKGESIWSPLKP